MVRSVMGGREFDFTKEQIEKRMSREEPEPIREHFVEIGGRPYPPKQVIATMRPEWPRTSFTTMEAQRVLARLGIPSKRYTATRMSDTAAQAMTADATDHLTAPREREGESDSKATEGRLARLEASLVVANQAIAALTMRVERLEGRPA